MPPIIISHDQHAFVRFQCVCMCIHCNRGFPRWMQTRVQCTYALQCLMKSGDGELLNTCWQSPSHFDCGCRLMTDISLPHSSSAIALNKSSVAWRHMAMCLGKSSIQSPPWRVTTCCRLLESSEGLVGTLPTELALMSALTKLYATSDNFSYGAYDWWVLTFSSLSSRSWSIWKDTAPAAFPVGSSTRELQRTIFPKVFV